MKNTFTLDSIFKFSCFVGIICIVMIFVNMWFLKEIIMKCKKEENKFLLLLDLFYSAIIVAVSIVLIFLSIQCFIL